MREANSRRNASARASASVGAAEGTGLFIGARLVRQNPLASLISTHRDALMRILTNGLAMVPHAAWGPSVRFFSFSGCQGRPCKPATVALRLRVTNPQALPFSGERAKSVAGFGRWRRRGARCAGRMSPVRDSFRSARKCGVRTSAPEIALTRACRRLRVDPRPARPSSHP